MLDALLVMATLQMQMEVFALDAGRQEISKQGVCAWLVLVLQASFQGESLKDRLSPAVFLKYFISRFAMCRGTSTPRRGGASGASRAHSWLHIHCDPGHFPGGEHAEDGSLWAQLCQGLGRRSLFLLCFQM